ncbi:MAG: GNAT family N-acetyltransferase [Salaquimonas sp.]
MFEKLQTDRLILRNWEERDRELFYEINSDEQVMQFFPFRRNRYQSDQMMDHLKKGISKDGHGFTAIELKKTKECVGFCGLHVCAPDLNLPDGTVEIGWRLSSKHWGKGYATEAALKWLEYGYETLRLDRIVSFAVHDNHASTAVMKRIGMSAWPEGDFDHDGVPAKMPHLKRHVFYELSRLDWLAQNQ